MSPTQTPPKAPSIGRPAPPPLPREDRSRFLLAAGLWALAVLALTAAAYRQFFAAPSGSGLLTDPDTTDYAQIARNMANGHGFATGILRPLAVTGFAGPDHVGTAPDVTRAPLYPFLLMLVFMARGSHGSDTTVIMVSLGLFLLSVLGVYRLARTLFPAPDQVWGALLAAGLYGVGGEALGGALAGGPVVLATLLVTALLIALHRAAETPARPAGFGGALWVGFLLGLCYLTQYSLLLLATPVLVYLFFSRAPGRAWAGVGACALGFLLAAGGWMARNAALSHGDPFFTLLFYGVMAQTPDFPGQTTIYRSVVPAVGPLAYFYTHLPLMLAKSGRGLTFYRDNLLHVFNVFLLAAAAASLLWRTADVRVGAVRACALIALLGIVVASSVFQPAAQMIAPFAPLVAVVAVGFVFGRVAEQGWEPLLQRTALWTLGALVCVGSLVQFAGQKPSPTDPGAQGMQALTNAGLTPIDNPGHLPGDAVISDAPWMVTWRANVPAIWMPADNVAFQGVVSSLSAAAQRGGGGGGYGGRMAMLLTPNMGAYTDDPAEAPAWLALLRDPLAYDHYQNTLAQADGIGALIRRHDRRVQRYTTQEVANAKTQADSAFMATYGSISDILANFQVADPRTPTLLESGTLPSALFVRRSVPSVIPQSLTQ